MHGQRADLILDLDATVFQVMAQTRQVVFGVAYSDPTAPPHSGKYAPPIPAH